MIPRSSGGKKEWKGACGVLVVTLEPSMHHGTTSHRDSQCLLNFIDFYGLAQAKDGACFLL